MRESPWGDGTERGGARRCFDHNCVFRDRMRGQPLLYFQCQEDAADSTVNHPLRMLFPTLPRRPSRLLRGRWGEYLLGGVSRRKSEEVILTDTRIVYRIAFGTAVAAAQWPRCTRDASSRTHWVASNRGNSLNYGAPTAPIAERPIALALKK